MIVCCVRQGDKYPVSYVHQLQSSVARHLSRAHKFICFTDNPSALKGIATVDTTSFHLKSWWAKMAIFAHSWRANERVLYFDLDTVIAGSLDPLAELPVDFGICANFTRAAGNLDWPCRYGSCVMSLGPDFDGDLFARFWSHRFEIMDRARKYGDQKAIEELQPDATLLQTLLPPNYFLGYRDLPEYKMAPPEGCSLVIFAGRSKPHNCSISWVKKEWR